MSVMLTKLELPVLIPLVDGDGRLRAYPPHHIAYMSHVYNGVEGDYRQRISARVMESLLHKQLIVVVDPQTPIAEYKVTQLGIDMTVARAWSDVRTFQKRGY